MFEKPSAINPPSYVDHQSFGRSPSYSAEPQLDERRIALALANRLPTGNFIKESKGGGVILRLNGQHDNINMPVYGLNGQVEGRVELPKTEMVETVVIKVSTEYKYLTLQTVTTGF